VLVQRLKREPAVSEGFFNDPILNSPYERPTQHWELVEGIPTEESVAGRRESRLITPIPQPRKRGGKGEQVQQRSLAIGDQEISDEKQQYEVTQQINSIRSLVAEWRQAPEGQWKVTPETARLLKHWRHHEFEGIRPFFCQIEAAETAIWLTEKFLSICTICDFWGLDRHEASNAHLRFLA
jgi:type III restriction enzyme